MKKRNLLVVALSALLIIGTQDASAQLGKLKSAMNKSKGGDSPSKGGSDKGSFSDFNSETDDLGITGQYFGLKDTRSFGFKFVKEAEGKLVNQLHYWEKKDAEPQLKMELKENYYTKHQVKLFFAWMSASASGYIEVIEVDPGVLAQIQGDRSSNGNNVPIGLDAKRKVVDVMVKDKASFDTWDIETAQAKVDMLIGTLKGAEGEKIKKNLMKYEVYSNYVGKIAFTKATNVLRNQKYNEPIEKKENFITKGELGNTIAWKPYFDQPLEVSHPGAWFNITYEMLGTTTDREVLRKSSTVFSKNIPQIDKDQEHFYFYYPRVLVDRSSNVADYAFLELLRKTQDQLKAGQTYDLKVTVWAFKDGANIAPVATGTIQLEYTKEDTGTKKYLTEPVHGWISKIETLLDE